MAEFDAYASEYDQALNQGLRLTGEGKEYYADGRVDWLAARMAALGARERAVTACLDFGCGTGTGCAPLRRVFAGAAYTGFDPSQSSIEEARRSWTLAPTASPAIEFTAEAAQLPASHFDLAFTNGVFHHIPPGQRADALAMVQRSLRPGGLFAFWENNRWNPIVHFLMSRVPFDRDAQMLFPHQARHLLRRAGFEILLTDYLFVFPAALKTLRPLEPRLCKLPLGGQYLVLARKPGPTLSPA
jgi:SAM-dependent methyltransferase